jgi:hypothetical protein
MLKQMPFFHIRKVEELRTSNNKTSFYALRTQIQFFSFGPWAIQPALQYGADQI